MEDNYKVYIKTDQSGNVIAIDSSAFISNTDDWIEIDEGFSDRFYHAQNNYLGEPLIDFEFQAPVYNYKFQDGILSKKSDEEKQTDLRWALEPNEDAIDSSILQILTPPSIDQLYADLQYLAMMSGIDI